MLRKIISCIPNTITLLNLLSGCAAIIFAFSHNDVFGPMTGQQWAYVMIGAEHCSIFSTVLRRVLYELIPLSERNSTR